MDDIPDFQEFFFCLRFPAKYMRIVLGDGKHAREARELAGLFVAIDLRR